MFLDYVCLRQIHQTGIFMRSFLIVNSISIFCLCALVQFTAVNAQEYHKSAPVKPDSTNESNLRLIRHLQQFSPAGTREAKPARPGKTPANTDETRREYYDSLMIALEKQDAAFHDRRNLQPAELDHKLPHPAFRLISDLAWNHFLMSADTTTSIALLSVLAKHYPAEQFVQGNLALAYEATGKPDSAIAVIKRYLSVRPAGFTTMNVEMNILGYKSGHLRSPGQIINLASDSFRIWVTDKLYKFPADIDSLRNALVTTIQHRATIPLMRDKLLGHLIFDYADLTAKEKSYRPALSFYNLALTFDPGLQTKTDGREAVIGELEKSVSSTFQWASVFFAVPLLAFVILIIGWIRNRKERKRS